MAGRDAYAELMERSASAPYKQVLVVEGPTDVEFLTIMLAKPPFRRENPAARWILGAAGGKDQVLKFLSRQPKWHGLVDRDAWDEQEIACASSQCAGLHLLPRFCLENFVIEPRVVYGALPEGVRRSMRVSERAFCQRIYGQLSYAVRHGALWRAIQPLYDGLRARGFNGALLDYGAELSEQAVHATLASWHDYLDPARLLAEFRRQLAAGEALDREQQLAVWVHGKAFWKNAVAPTLEQLGDPLGAGARMRSLLRAMDPPEDLVDTLRFMMRDQ